MARVRKTVTKRTNKKPSKAARTRRNMFWKQRREEGEAYHQELLHNQNVLWRNKLLVAQEKQKRKMEEKEKEWEEAEKHLHKEYNDMEIEYNGLRELRKGERRDFIKEKRKALGERDKIWEEKLKKKGDEWEKRWETKVKEIKDADWVIREREKQDFSRDLGKLVKENRDLVGEQDGLLQEIEGLKKGKEEVEFERDQLRDTVADLAEEIMRLKGEL